MLAQVYRKFNWFRSAHTNYNTHHDNTNSGRVQYSRSIASHISHFLSELFHGVIY